MRRATRTGIWHTPPVTDGRGAHRWGHVKGFGAAWVQAQRVRRRLARGFGPDAMMSRKPRPFQELVRIV